MPTGDRRQAGRLAPGAPSRTLYCLAVCSILQLVPASIWYRLVPPCTPLCTAPAKTTHTYCRCSTRSTAWSLSRWRSRATCWSSLPHIRWPASHLPPLSPPTRATAHGGGFRCVSAAGRRGRTGLAFFRPPPPPHPHRCLVVWAERGTGPGELPSSAALRLRPACMRRKGSSRWLASQLCPGMDERVHSAAAGPCNPSRLVPAAPASQLRCGAHMRNRGCAPCSSRASPSAPQRRARATLRPPFFAPGPCRTPSCCVLWTWSASCGAP